MLDNLKLIPGEAFTATGSVVEKTIDKVADATGWIITPKGNYKNQLEAETYLIEQIKNDSNMPPLAKAAAISNVKKLIKEYINKQNVLSIAVPYLVDNARPESVDDDWISFFFDKVKNVSKEEMLIIWGKVLAGEMNTPGTISKSLIHVLSIIDNEDATTFQKIASFSVNIGNEKYVILFDNKYNEIYSKIGLSQEDVLKLADIGLLQYEAFGNTIQMLEKTTLEYFDSKFEINITDKVALGNITLSKAAIQLLTFIEDKKRVEEFEVLLSKIIGSDSVDILLEKGEK